MLNIPVVPTAIYPFEALMKEQRGTVEVECLVDMKGRLIKADIIKSPSPEFSGTVLAYLEANDFSLSVKQAKLGQEFIVVSMHIEFDERKYEDLARPMTCPSDSEMSILSRLKEGKPVKSIAPSKELDQRLAPKSTRAPIFPLSLVGQVNKGKALVEFYIDKKGSACLPRTVSASDPAFGYAACLAISMWKFEPPKRNGKPAVVKVRIPVNFKNNTPGVSKG